MQGCVQPDWGYLRGLHGVYNLIDVIYAGYTVCTTWLMLFTRVTRCVQPDWCYLRGLHGVYNLIDVISSWIEQKLRSILKYLLNDEM